MKNRTLAALLFISAPICVVAQPAGDGERSTVGQTAEDHRVLVDIPESVQATIRSEMREHLTSLHAIVAALADQRLDDVAEIASEQFGSGRMRNHRNRGGGPGRHLPPAMRSIGRSMHSAADAVAEAAREGDQTEAMRHLGQITAACSACHSSYRIR